MAAVQYRLHWSQAEAEVAAFVVARKMLLLQGLSVQFERCSLASALVAVAQVEAEAEELQCMHLADDDEA